MAMTVRAFVLILIGLVVGSLVRPVLAQPETSPFEVGRRLTLSYQERVVDCTVVEIRGSFLRCEKTHPDPFSRAPRYADWHNTATTEFISVREK